MEFYEEFKAKILLMTKIDLSSYKEKLIYHEVAGRRG